MSEPNLGRIAKPLADFIEWFIGARLDYHAHYPCTVITQNANGSLALRPDDERVRGFGLDSVFIRTGLPGVTATVAAGSRVHLGFDAGDPKRPYAGLWDTSSLVNLTITATGTVTVDAPTINLANADGPVLRSGETMFIAGVQAGAGVTAIITSAAVPGFPVSDVSA